MVPGRSLVSASEKMPGYSKNCRIGYGYPRGFPRKGHPYPEHHFLEIK